MENKHEIVICLGSSCFARGNKPLVKVIQDFLKENNLNSEVDLHGQRCFDMCTKGPMVKIDNELYEHIDEPSILKVLENKFL